MGVISPGVVSLGVISTDYVAAPQFFLSAKDHRIGDCPFGVIVIVA